jgi:transposase
VAPGAHAIRVLDGAGWHTSHVLEPPDNITLLCLPPYSPELNPVENVWEYLRKNNLVEEEPDVAVHGVVRWRCVDLQAQIKARFDVDLSERHIPLKRRDVVSTKVT